MRPARTIDIVARHLSWRSSLRWLAIGAVVGIAADVWGDSWIPPLAMKVVSGIGLPSMCLVLLIVALYGLGRTHGTAGRLARGDFENLFPWLHGNLMRATSVLLGLATVAAIAWWTSGSGSAAIVASLSLWFAIVYAWYWVCLAVVAEEHAARTGSKFASTAA